MTAEVARQALAASFAVWDRTEKWSNLDGVEDRVWRAVLGGFSRTGRAPSLSQLSSASALPAPAVSASLHRLRARDLVVLDEKGAVTAAYPFCDWPTGHQVRFDGRIVNALCAIDALGIGAMHGRDAAIESACQLCGTEIRIATRSRGSELDTVSPPQAVVWSGMRYENGCAATSGCTLKIFFCSDDHLRRWSRIRSSDEIGFCLSIDEALQVGKAIFVPMLRPARLRPEQSAERR